MHPRCRQLPPPARDRDLPQPREVEKEGLTEIQSQASLAAAPLLQMAAVEDLPM